MLLESVYILYNNMCDVIALEICIVHWCTSGVTFTFEHVHVVCIHYPAITQKKQAPIPNLTTVCTNFDLQYQEWTRGPWGVHGTRVLGMQHHHPEPALPGKFEAA